MTNNNKPAQASAFTGSLEGELERIVYQNPDNGYTVAKLSVDNNTEKLVTVTGLLTAVSIGETIRAQGEWTVHKQYGKQFEIKEYETLRPNDLVGMEKYLGSGLIKGIGPVTAKKIIDKFDKDSFDIIDNHPERLKEINGLGKKKCDIIVRGWKDEKESKEVMLFLQSHDIGISHSIKIYNFYGKQTLQQLKTNPYQLIYDIRGIGFKSADKIAKNIGIEPDSKARIKAALIYIMNMAEDEGHMYLSKGQHVERTVELLGIPPGDIISCLNELIEHKFLIKEADQIFSCENYLFEIKIAEKLKSLMEPGKLKSLDFSLFDNFLLKVQDRLKFKFSDEQINAVNAVLRYSVFVLTGGPGTGKTTTVKGIIEILKCYRQSINLAAPTGRAAKRLEETTRTSARTIHRLLEFNPVLGRFARNEKMPLDCDVMIVDESSMIDAQLMSQLLSAVCSGTRLILVGDVDQLPSVGAGNILRDIIDSKKIPVVRLWKIFRQLKNSDIITNAHKINVGERLDLSNTNKTNFFFIYEKEPEMIVDVIISLCKTRLPQKYNVNPIHDIQVITPMYKGHTGAENLNSSLQNVLNPNGREVRRGTKLFRSGDKVMQIKNNYDKNVYNGDIGEIKTIDSENLFLNIRFEDRIVSYEFKDLDEIVLAYAITAHKSQGSEYKIVVMPVTTQHYVMLQRNLLYTAITRAKQIVILVGTHKAVSIAVANNVINERNTMLKVRLAEKKKVLTS